MKTIKYLHAAFLLLILGSWLPVSAGAQEIITGLDFFDRVAQNYDQIEDYIADVEMVVDNEVLSGLIYFKNPNLIRIDFIEPEEQVLVSDGNIMQVYVPAYNVTLTQSLREQANPGGFATGEGLSLLRRNYQIAFKDSPSPQPLDQGGGDGEELVYKLFLTWRNTSQGFREIEIAVTPDLLIRRMTAVTADRRNVVFTFKNIQINQSIPLERFNYESPPSSNNFDNFLYGAE